jgi:hypothetical protein
MQLNDENRIAPYRANMVLLEWISGMERGHAS